MNRQSLGQAQIKHILKLQELFHNRFLNEELLNQLVCLYVKAIGCLTQSLSLMKVYFLQKMQFLLSRPEIQKLLTQDQSQKSTRDKYTIKISSIQLEYQCEQYVKTSSLHSQPVGKKLSEMQDENEKLRERENRIKNQLELMRDFELNMIQIPLQKGHNQSIHFSSHKIHQTDFEGKEATQTKKQSNTKRRLRKNSDCLKVENQVQIMLNGKNLTKACLQDVQKVTNSKLYNPNLNVQIQYPSFSDQKAIVGRNLNFRIFNMRQNDNSQMEEGLQKISFNEEDLQNEEKCWQTQQDGFGTFAVGFKTPQFSESSSSSPVKNFAVVFPKPMDEITDTTVKNDFQGKQDERIEEIIISEDESQKDYADDDYF